MIFHAIARGERGIEGEAVKEIVAREFPEPVKSDLRTSLELRSATCDWLILRLQLRVMIFFIT